MLLRYFVVLSFFLIIVITPVFGQYSDMIVTEDDKNGPHIKSMNSYVDQIGYLHIIGEFVNNQNKALEYVKLTGIIYDANDTPLDVEFSFTDLDIVPPYGKSVFDISFAGGASGVKQYNVKVSYKETPAQPMGLKFKSRNIQTDEIGYTHLLGTVQNMGEKTANYVKVIGAVYDQQGKIIGTGFTFTEPNDLYNKRSGTFDVVIDNKLNPDLIASYGIHAVSQEYGLIFDKPVTAMSNEITQTEPNGGGCLIATATFDTELAPQVQQLRELRDNQLLKTEYGSTFMSTFNQFYYSFSPTVADLERQSPILKESIKVVLTPMLSSLSILNFVDMDSEESVLGYGISLIVLNLGMYFVAPTMMFYIIRKFKNH